MKNSNIGIVSWGGIGDALLTTPLFRAIKEQLPNSRITVYITRDAHYDVFLNNPYIDRLRKLGSLIITWILFLEKCKVSNFFTPGYAKVSPSLFYSKNATEIIAEMFGITLEHKRVNIFLTKEEEDFGKQFVSPYLAPVAIHVTGHCSKNKNWPISHWTE